MEILFSPHAPAPIGPYSQWIQSWDIVFLSWQIWLDPETTSLVGWGVENETEQLCKNIQAVLKSKKMDYHHVIKTTIFLTDIADFEKVNTIYGKYFDHKPARSTVQVAKLPRWASIEIECIAVTW